MSNLHEEKYRLLVDSLVANYIKQFGNPPLKDKELDKYTEQMFSHYVNNNDNFTRFVNNIPIDLSNVHIVDRTGRSLFIDIRNGNSAIKNQDKNKSRTIKYNGIIEPRQISETNRYAFYLILKNDFKESSKRQGMGRIITTPSREIRQNSPTTLGGSFEKDFKDMVLKGKASDVLAAASVIINRLPENEKLNLTQSFKASGIYTQDDLKGLLNQWKSEAQSQEQKPEHTQARNRTIGHEPTMSL
jgi:hypothetical protein